ERGFVEAGGLMDVVVDIAVADMAERIRSDARHPFFDRGMGPGNERRDLAHRYRDIVLDARALEFLCFDEAFADAPEFTRLRAAFSDNAVFDKTGFHAVGEEALQRLEQPALCFAR